jgi:hypothetical protein
MSLLLVKRDITAVQPFNPPQARETVCGCDFATCFTERVFADVEASGDFWKADKSDFLFRKQSSSDTVVFELWKKGRLVTALNNNTYGDYYASFTDTALQTGFVVDWTTIFAAFGGGIYTVKIQYTTFGTLYTLESREFNLLPYKPELAHNTVRIESYQTGNIIGSDVDYSLVLADLPKGWYSSIRLEGRFWASGNDLVLDQFLNFAYEVTQNNNEVVNEYSFETRIIPDSVNTRITQDQILANSVLITDYNLYASRIFRRKEVVPTAFSEVEQFEERGGTKFIITFGDRKKNIKKRNF